MQLRIKNFAKEDKKTKVPAANSSNFAADSAFGLVVPNWSSKLMARSCSSSIKFISGLAFGSSALVITIPPFVVVCCCSLDDSLVAVVAVAVVFFVDEAKDRVEDRFEKCLNDDDNCGADCLMIKNDDRDVDVDDGDNEDVIALLIEIVDEKQQRRIKLITRCF